MQHRKIFILVSLISVIPLAYLTAGGETELLSWSGYMQKHSASVSSDQGTHILAHNTSDVQVAEFTYDENEQQLSVFYPPGADFESAYPVVILMGNPDLEVIRDYGKAYSYTAHALGWAQVLAEGGFIVITYESPRNPAKDVVKVVEWLRTKGKSYGIDSSRIGLFSSSDSCIYALKATRPEKGGIPYPSLAFSVLAYGSLMDLSGMDTHVGYCIVSAEDDTAWTDQSTVDSFYEMMTQAGADIVRLHHTTGNHAFEMAEYSEESEKIIHEIILFMRSRADL